MQPAVYMSGQFTNMQIDTVQIQRYRAFNQRVTVPVMDLTVLTGPNNLGKSTVLSALELFFSVLEPRTSLRLSRSQRYSFEDDYPKSYEGRSGRRWPTQIRVNLVLDNEDMEKLSAELGGAAPARLTATVEYRWSDPSGVFRPHIEFTGFAPGPQHIALLAWLRNNVRYVYIPAARNAHDLRRGVFGELISGALSRVSRSRQRLQALEKLFEDVKAEIAEVERELAEELRHYLPSVKQLRFSIEELDLNRIVSVGEIEIDDGARTNLQQKGDGFKSLFAISLLQYIARQKYGKNLIFGIEEPEAHLHSAAIYEIKSTLRGLAKSFQVLVTTHSPILIQRDNIAANVIVESAGSIDFASVTRAARNLADIRRSLGIRPHENMTTAEVVLVVEGASEERAMPAVLARIEPQLIEAFSSGRARVLAAGGAQNIPAVVRALARDATSCLVLVDSDDAGKAASERIRNSGLLQPSDVFHVPTRDGSTETEFEDLFVPAAYLANVCAATGISLTVEQFFDCQRRSGGRGSRFAKWSAVMSRAANEQAIDWSGVAELGKTAFAAAIASHVDDLPLEQLAWSRAIAMRTAAYLLEAQEPALG